MVGTGPPSFPTRLDAALQAIQGGQFLHRLELGLVHWGEGLDVLRGRERGACPLERQRPPPSLLVSKPRAAAPNRHPSPHHTRKRRRRARSRAGGKGPEASRHAAGDKGLKLAVDGGNVEPVGSRPGRPLGSSSQAAAAADSSQAAVRQEQQSDSSRGVGSGLLQSRCHRSKRPQGGPAGRSRRGGRRQGAGGRRQGGRRQGAGGRSRGAGGAGGRGRRQEQEAGAGGRPTPSPALASCPSSPCRRRRCCPLACCAPSLQQPQQGGVVTRCPSVLTLLPEARADDNQSVSRKAAGGRRGSGTQSGHFDRITGRGAGGQEQRGRRSRRSRRGPACTCISLSLRGIGECKKSSRPLLLPSESPASRYPPWS